MNTSSSTITGDACAGSSTPPSCAPALRCTRSPTCAHEPTSACESMVVLPPTYAPRFTSIGGMQMTPGAAHDRSSRHDANAVCERKVTWLEQPAIEEPKRTSGHAPHLHHVAHAVREEHPQLHPLHGVPSAARVALGRAYLATLEGIEQLPDHSLRGASVERAALCVRRRGALDVLADAFEIRWHEMRARAFLDDRQTASSPRANISSAFRIDAPAAPRIVLCPIATRRRSRIGSSRTRPTTTDIPFPAFTSRRGCGRSRSRLTMTGEAGALGNASSETAPFHTPSASIACFGVAGDASLTDMHAVWPCSTATRFTCALTRIGAGVTAPRSKVPRVF